MKKSKLIASICTLVLTLACLTFGVYSAVKTTFTASGTIVFNAYNIDLDVKGTIKGTAEAVTDFYATTTYSETAKTDATRQTYNQNNLASGWNFGNIAFDELGANSNGYIDNTITITLSFTNYSGFPVKVNVEQTSTNANLTITKNDIQYISKYDTSTLATADTQVVTIIITPNGTAISKESLVFNVNAQPSELTEATAAELTYTITDGKAVISAYTGASDTFVIPSKIVDNGVTYPTTLKSGTTDTTTKVTTPGLIIPNTTTGLVIPGTIETIPEKLCYGNTYLKNLVVCNGVKSIGVSAFRNCSNLKNVKLGSSVEVLNNYSFQDCIAIEQIIIPDSVIELGAQVFANCSGLKNVKIGNSVASMGKYAFSGSNSAKASKIKSIEIPQSVKTIGMFAFSDCVYLKSVKLNEGLLEIGFATFNGCSALSSINFPDSIEWIGDFAFDHCSSLTCSTITLPKEIKQIGGNSYIKLDSTNGNYDTQDEVDAARRAVLGTHVFYDCATSSLTAFAIDSSNQYYMVKDGILYTKNISGEPITLVAYPSRKFDVTYEMPDSVTNGYECAMSRPYYLKNMILSDSFVIKEIPFSRTGYGLNGDWGNNLQCMLYTFHEILNIECKSTNTKYVSESGAIYGKSDNVLYYMPIYTTAENQTFSIKDGTTTIQSGAIGQNKNATTAGYTNEIVYRYAKIYIPKSVVSIGEKTLKLLNKENIESYYTVEIDSVNAKYTISNGKIVTK